MIRVGKARAVRCHGQLKSRDSQMCPSLESLSAIMILSKPLLVFIRIEYFCSIGKKPVHGTPPFPLSLQSSQDPFV